MRNPARMITEDAETFLRYREGRLAFESRDSVSELFNTSRFVDLIGLLGWLDALADKLDSAPQSWPRSGL